MIDMFSITLIGVIAGASGGLVRGLVGISKHILSAKKKFQPLRFVSFIIIAGIVGAVAGAIIFENWVLSLLAGYAGADFIEGVYKAKLFNLITPIKK